MNRTVYNIETGKEVSVPGVDAIEYVATGGWTYDKPAIKKTPDKVYKTEAAANATATKAGYTAATHEILPHENGYIISEKTVE